MKNSQQEAPMYYKLVCQIPQSSRAWMSQNTWKICFSINQRLCVSIVNIVEWLWSSANFKGTTKMERIMLEGPTLCTILFEIIFITERFLLVSCSDRSKPLLCFVHGLGQKANKNIKQRTLSSFLHSLY